MIPGKLKEKVKENFSEAIGDGNKNVYFSQFHSSRELSRDAINETFSELKLTDYMIHEEYEDGYEVSVSDAYLYIWETDEERWIFSYSSDLDRRIRDKFDDLANKIGWILDVWIPGETVNSLFHERSPDQKSVNIERRWDPYWVYERGGEIPEELQSYYNENYENFVEQEIEFNLKTPKALVDRALKQGVQPDLLEKSEISESKFTYRSDEAILMQDGGVTATEQSGPESKVTVRGRGQVVHSTGDEAATFDLLDEIDRRTDYYEKFEEAIPERDYERLEDGSLEVRSYSPGKVLKFKFTEETFDQEASIKIANLLTVGQNDVDIHGTVGYWDDLEFLATSYTAYDEGEYEIYLTGEKTHPVLYVKPRDGQVSGLVYLFRKLKEKFDPRIEVGFEEKFPNVGES